MPSDITSGLNVTRIELSLPSLLFSPTYIIQTIKFINITNFLLVFVYVRVCVCLCARIHLSNTLDI